MAGQGLKPKQEPERVLLRTRIPSRELSDRKLIARLKATKGMRTTYEDFLVARKGKTDITPDRFGELIVELAPDPAVREEWIVFLPTHADRRGQRYMILDRTREGYRLIREDGVLGTSPEEEFPEFFSPI